MTWRVDVQTSNGEAGRSNGYVTHWCGSEAEADVLVVRLATRTNPAVAWDWEPTEPWDEERSA